MDLKKTIIPLAALWMGTGFVMAQASGEKTGPQTVLITAPATAGSVPPKSAASPASRPAPIRVTDDTVVEFFQKYEPEVYKQLMVLKDKDKGKFDAMVRDFKGEVQRLLELQRRNEPLFNVTMEDRRIGFETLQLARSIREGKLTPQELESANKQLEDLVGQQFELRQKIRQAALDEQKARIEAIEKNLEDIRKNYENLLAQFSNREKTEDDLVKQRMSDLLKRNPKVEW